MCFRAHNCKPPFTHPCIYVYISVSPSIFISIYLSISFIPISVYIDILLVLFLWRTLMNTLFSQREKMAWGSHSTDIRVPANLLVLLTSCSLMKDDVWLELAHHSGLLLWWWLFLKNVCILCIMPIFYYSVTQYFIFSEISGMKIKERKG